jgi:DNA-binding transcriptional LysR family regulator
MNEVVDSRQMLAFVTIAIQGSLKSAALRLHLTESALSHSLKNLEENLGVKLFERDSKRLILSEAGHLALEDAVQILDNMKLLRDRMQGEALTDQKTLRVVVGPSFFRFYCPQIIDSLQKTFSGCRIKIQVGDRSYALKAIEKDEVDFAITIDPPKDTKKYNVEPLFSDELSFIIGLNHPLAEFDIIHPRQLSSQSIYLSNIDSYSTARIVRNLTNSGGMLRHLTETRSKESILQMVAMGLGCSFQPTWICQNELNDESIQVKELEDFKIERSWSIVSSAIRKFSKIDQAFIELCHKSVSDNPVGLTPSRTATDHTYIMAKVGQFALIFTQAQHFLSGPLSFVA